jgi:hypothetical protein
LIFALLTLSSAPAWGATVNIQCPRLTDPAKGELEARARLFLTSADMENASIGVECDATSATLIWTDGTKSSIDARTNIVEGTLDAIEDRIARAKRAAANGGSGEGGTGGEGSSAAGGAGANAGGTKRPADVPPEEPKPESTPVDRGIDLEGGVGLALLSEIWSGTYTGAVGPRLDVGVGIGRKFAIVISEGARFGIGGGSGYVMVFDLHAGVAYGAPYQMRTGFGIMAQVGAERLAATAAGTGDFSGIWVWAATATLGVRGSLAAGPLDIWLGVDGLARSQTITTGKPNTAEIPEVSAVFSVGCFLPAFAGGTKTEPVAPGAAR